MWSMGSGMGREESLTAVELGPRPLSRCAAFGRIASHAGALRMLSADARATAPAAPRSSAAAGSAGGSNEAFAAVAVHRARARQPASQPAAFAAVAVLSACAVLPSEARGSAQRAVPRTAAGRGEITSGVAMALAALSAQETGGDRLQWAEHGFAFRCDV